MKPWLYFLCCIFSTMSLAADSGAKQQLADRLAHFLAGASVNDAAIHDDFWHPDLIYTSSSGQRFGKAQLMLDVRETGPVAKADVATWYSAEEVNIQLLDDMAVLTFKLVGKGNDDTQYYLNSGTFIRTDDGTWQAINWQATKAAD